MRGDDTMYTPSPPTMHSAQFEASPRGSSTAQQPHGRTGHQHLRQRSVTQSSTTSHRTHQNQDPFADHQQHHHPNRAAVNPFGEPGSGRSSPAFPHAAMMDVNLHDDDSNADNMSIIARNMRDDRAEWTPTKRYLYSEASFANSATSLAPGTPLGPMSMSAFSTPNGSPSGSLSGHSTPGSQPHSHSQARFDVVADPALLLEYSTAPEVDDALHDAGPPPKREGPDRRIVESDDFRGSTVWTSWRGWLNMGAVMILAGGLLMLFGGMPIYTEFSKRALSDFGASGLGGTNSTGQVPEIAGFRGLIDKDTPASAMTRTGFDGEEYSLVFSDEFEQDGRSFDDGLDPYWRAVSLHYWQTGDKEYYDPDSITTENGSLVITLTREPNETSHGLGYLSGMLQSWNQFCFTGGYIEVAASLPGDTRVSGLWPAAWTLSNLGRAGYGGSLDGTWPYSYEACDLGTLPNQTNPITNEPVLPAGSGDEYNFDALSYLGGQKLSACTCPGEDHPGPILPDGSFKGRGSAEIDIIEATVNLAESQGEISQSAQWAPFNPRYEYINSSSQYVEFWPENIGETHANVYKGGVFQQVTSGLAKTDNSTYNSTTNFAKYGFEYMPSYINGFGTGWITWSEEDQRTWQIRDRAMSANAAAQVSDRPVTGEPLSIVLNLGLSDNFGWVDEENLEFPAKYRIDSVRVYQRKDMINIGCDPKLYPTADYIAKHPDLYNNPNITVLADVGKKFPKNRLVDTCT